MRESLKKGLTALALTALVLGPIGTGGAMAKEKAAQSPSVVQAASKMEPQLNNAEKKKRVRHSIHVIIMITLVAVIGGLTVAGGSGDRKPASP